MKTKEQKEKALNLNRIIGKNIKALIVKNGITLRGLGKILGVSYQMIQKYEKGTNSIGMLYLHLLSHYFDVTTEYFFEDRSEDDNDG